MQITSEAALKSHYAAIRKRINSARPLASREKEPKRDWIIVGSKAVIDRPGLAIMREVCAKYGVTLKDVLSRRRTGKIALPRQEIMWRLRHETPASLPQIGRMLHRDHTSVLYGIRRYSSLKEIGAVE